MKHKKYYGYGAIGLTLAAIGVAFLSPLNSSNFLFRARAANVTGGNITFSGSNASKSGTTNTTNCDTRVGGNIICKTFDNDDTQSSGLVGAVKLGSSIRFYESDGTTEFTFEDLDKISFAYSGKFGFWLHVLHANGNEVKWGSSGAGSATPYGTNAVNKETGLRTINFTSYDNVSQIWVECTSTNSEVALMSNIYITYNCESKSLTGLKVTSAPDKVVYNEGEYFDPSGLKVNAVYSNDMEIATDSFTYSPTRALTTSDEYVTIYFKDVSINYPISVEEIPSGMVGTYKYRSSSDVDYYIVLEANGSGYYHIYYSGSFDDYMHFTYVVSDGEIIFTKNEQPGDSTVSSGFNNLFTTSGEYNTRNTAAINNSGNILLKTCTASSRASSTKEMVKQ